MCLLALYQPWLLVLIFMINFNPIFIISSILPILYHLTRFIYKSDQNDQKEMLHALKRHCLMLRYSKLKLFRQRFGLGSGLNTPHRYAPEAEQDALYNLQIARVPCNFVFIPNTHCPIAHSLNCPMAPSEVSE